MIDNSKHLNSATLKEFIDALKEGLQSGFGGGSSIEPVRLYTQKGRRRSENAITNDIDRVRKAKEGAEIKKLTDKIEKLDKLIEDSKKKSVSNWATKREAKKEKRKLEDLKNEYEHGAKIYNKAEAYKYIFDLIGSGLNDAMKGVHAITDMHISHEKNELKQYRNAVDKQQKLFQAHMDMSNVVVSNTVTSISSMATQTAIQGSRAVAKGAMEESNAYLKMVAQETLAHKEFTVAEKGRELDYVKEQLNNTKNLNSAISGIAGLFGPVGMAASVAITALTDTVTSLGEVSVKLGEFDMEVMKQQNEIYKMVTDNISAITGKAQKFVGGIVDTANAVTDKLMQSETVYKQMGVTMGFQGESYTKFMQKVQEGSSKYFNITAEQMKQMTESYSNASGRNLIFNDNDYNQMTSMSRTYGVGQGEIASMLGEMNVFNTSISDGYDVMTDMWHIATKLGLSTSKFSKDLVQNLKLAQKYNFKSGVDNMAKLTMWANKVKFNLQNAVAFADKMMSNNISDVLETSAKLQVLGGNASIYADPMAMMWEAGNDVGALAKRQYAMFGDITGTFNSKTGETTFSEYELRRIREIAGAMGMNYEDVLNQKRLEGRQRVINRELAGYGLDEDTLNGIAQRATFSKKKNSMVVKTMQGEMTIQQFASLSEKMRSKIMLPENQESALMEVATNTRSLTETADAQLAFLTATMAPHLWNTIQETTQKQLDSQMEFMNNGNVVDALKEGLVGQTNLSVAQNKSTAKTLEENNGIIKDYFSFAEQNIGRQNAFQEMEVKLLAAMAKPEGVTNIMEIVDKVSQVLVEPDKDKRKTLLSDLNALRNNSGNIEFIDSLLGTQGNITWDEINARDGYGFTNGGYIAGASVTPINDGRGSLVKTHPNDQFLAAKSGGPIDKLFDIVNSIITNNGVSGNRGKLNIEFTGNINLQDKSGNINLVEIMRNDPITAREFTRLIVKTMDSSSNGKVSQNYYI